MHSIRLVNKNKMDLNDIRDKFSDNYIADERTFVMGMDQRSTAHFAERYIGINVLETYTGAGFTTISLARSAKYVFSVEINKSNQEQAIINIEKT
jgi:hypothetical protein